MSSAWEEAENRKIPIKKSSLSRQYGVPTVVQLEGNYIKPASIEIGRFCKCGCGKRIPQDARKDRLFFNGTCRRVYTNTIMGYTDSKNVVRARLRIKGPITLTLYPRKTVCIKIKISEECKEILNVCKKIMSERQNG